VPYYEGAGRTDKEYHRHVRETTYKELQKLRRSKKWQKYVQDKIHGLYPPIELARDEIIIFSDE